MRKFALLQSFICLVITATGQTKVDSLLKRQLDSIYSVDQQYRGLLSSQLLTSKADSLATAYNVSKAELINVLIQKMQSSDSSNLVAIVQIFQKQGYPGKSLVGAPTNEAAFYVIQHSNDIEKYLPLIQAAAEKDELPFTLYAMMVDRYLMYKGKEQVYGTQVKGFETYNPATNKKEFVKVVWAIQKPSEVNQRRKAAGFTQTVEENAKRLGVEYRPLSLQDIAAMQNNTPTNTYTNLKKQIDSLFKIDQQVQQNMITAFQRGASIDSIKIYESLEKQTFSRHIPILKIIFEQNGYPASDKVGAESAYRFFVLVQHADADLKFQEKMLKSIKAQVDKKQLNGKEYAYLYDRVQINSGKPQLYGTQLDYDNAGNAVVKKLKDRQNVNIRRQQFGMDTLEDYLSKATEMHQKMNKRN